MAIQDSDLLLVSRSNSLNKVTYGEFKDSGFVSPPRSPEIGDVQLYNDYEPLPRFTNQNYTTLVSIDDIGEPQGTGGIQCRLNGNVSTFFQTDEIESVNQVVSPYTIEKSCHCNDDPNMYTNSFQDKGDNHPWTLSVWIRSGTRGKIMRNERQGGDQVEVVGGTPGQNLVGTFRVAREVGSHFAGYWTEDIGTTQTLEELLDGALWGHFVISCQGTNTQFYFNGVEIPTRTDRYTGSVMDKNGKVVICSNRLDNGFGLKDPDTHFVGIAEMCYISGQKLTPTSFGQDVSGTWCPIEYTGTASNNSFYLKFLNSSNMGQDSSGNNRIVWEQSNRPTWESYETPTTSFPATIRFESALNFDRFTITPDKPTVLLDGVYTQGTNNTAYISAKDAGARTLTLYGANQWALNERIDGPVEYFTDVPMYAVMTDNLFVYDISTTAQPYIPIDNTQPVITFGPKFESLDMEPDEYLPPSTTIQTSIQLANANGSRTQESNIVTPYNKFIISPAPSSYEPDISPFPERLFDNRADRGFIINANKVSNPFVGEIRYPGQTGRYYVAVIVPSGNRGPSLVNITYDGVVYSSTKTDVNAVSLHNIQIGDAVNLPPSYARRSQITPSKTDAAITEIEVINNEDPFDIQMLLVAFIPDGVGDTDYANHIVVYNE